MKEFDCGAVVPGCQVRFRADSEDELLREVSAHAREGHGLRELPSELVERVRTQIRDVPG